MSDIGKITFISLQSPTSPVTVRRNITLIIASVRVPDSQLEGFESCRKQVGGSVMIHPPCQNVDNFVHPTWPAPSNKHWAA